jgi:hypothetical protein
MDAHSPLAIDTLDAPCPGCGRRRTADDSTGLAWSSEHAPDGTVTFICPACTRADIARIEAGLPDPERRSPAA